MRFVLLLALLCSAVGCGPQPDANPMARLADDEAGEVVRRAIEAAGGWDAWASAHSLDYQKTTTWFDSTGVETRRLVQHHQYDLSPTPRMRIAYTDDEGHEILLVNDGREAGKWVDGERVTTDDDTNQAWNSTYGSHYVMGQPFKLTDPGTRLTYAGRDSVAGVLVDAVRADYEEGAGSAGGLHTWTYYVAVDDGRMVANHLRYGTGPDDYDLTVYHDIREVNGLRLPMGRTSYHSNAEADPLARASTYRNEEVRVGAPLADSLFALR